MTDSQMLQNLLAVQETMTILNLCMSPGGWLPELKEVIEELRRRVLSEGVHMTNMGPDRPPADPADRGVAESRR